MSDLEKKVLPSDDVNIGLLTTDDWVELSAFFDAAVFDNPTTENRMRIKLGMKSEDTFLPEFAETVDMYADLRGLGEDFKSHVSDEAMTLADDIVHYNLTVQSVFPRLIKLIDYFDMDIDETATTQQKLDALVELWKKGQTDGISGKIKDRLKVALENLISDAKARADRATSLHEKIMGDGKGPTEEDGMLNRLKAVKARFDNRKVAFHDTFGTASTAVAALKSKMESVEKELAGLKQKDKDETIVLSTAPAYLVIPLFGPFIMAGVLIGVGVDMANVRAKIDSLVQEAATLESKISQDERFIGYYSAGEDMVAKMATKCEAIAPRLERLGKGWRAIAADLQFIVDLLSDQGQSNLQKEDFSSFAGSLETARTSWAAIAVKADHFRLVAVASKAETVDDAMGGVTIEDKAA